MIPQGLRVRLLERAAQTPYQWSSGHTLST